ncbi:hypothetical protein V8D89_003822 [Ganoderma adspersum]
MQGSIARRVWARSRRREMNPQYWYIANVDTKELSYENFGVLGDWFYNKHVELFRSIYLPCLPSEYDGWCANYTTQPSALFALPPEVLALIFAELRDLPHVIALAITCRYLLSVGKAEVLRATRAHHAPWAGCRLICFGTYMRPDDVPERMLSEREGEVMRRWLAAWRLSSREREGEEDDEDGEDDDEGGAIGDHLGNGGGESDDSEGARERGVSFPDVACGDYRLVFGWVWALARANPAQHLIGAIEDEGKQPSPDTSQGEPPAKPLPGGGRQLSAGTDAQAPAHQHRARASERDYELFSALYGSDHWAAAYPSGPRALCNLSKGEYVREDALRTARGARLGVGRRIEWGHVLLTRICWSSSSESGMPGDGNVNERLCRGPWAGDRVCITSVDVLPELEGGRAWRDASAEVEEVLSGVWKTDTGAKRDSSPGTRAAFHPWEICCSSGDKK